MEESSVKVRDRHLRNFRRSCWMLVRIGKCLNVHVGERPKMIEFIDDFDTKTKVRSGTQVIFARHALSMWISNKINLAKCLCGDGLSPETVVYFRDSGLTKRYKMNDATSLMHDTRMDTARWYVKPVGQSEGRGIKVIRAMSSARMEIYTRRRANEWNATRDYVCQKEISPPLLVKTHAGLCKFDTRFYCIADTQGGCYVYPEARVRCANVPYSPDRTNPLANVCNTTLQSRMLGVKTEDLGGPKLLSQVPDGRDLIERSVTLICRAVKHASTLCCRRALASTHRHACKAGVTVYCALGVDVGYDIEGRPWIIEINKRPLVLDEPYYHNAMTAYLKHMIL